MFSWLPAISLANPAFLVGMAAGVIPVLIHLIYRRRAPQVLFSTLRFIRLSTQKTARRRRIEDLLLLIFRVLLFSFLAAALAQPFLKAGGLISPNAAVNSVIILDNSMSMATMEQGITRYNRAKQMTREVLNRFPEGTSALLLITNPTEATQTLDPDKLSLRSDLIAIYEVVAGSEPSPGKADLVANLMTAYKILGRITEPNREIYVICDLQRVSWETEWNAKEGPEALEDISLILVPCGSRDFKNAAVTAIELSARGRVVGAPTIIKAQVSNSSPVELADIPVALFVDDAKEAERTATIPADSDVSVAFNYAFESSGAHVGLVNADVDDSLPLDDSRLFSVTIEQKTKVLIVKEKTNPITFLDPGFYLSTALDPGEASGIAVTEIEQGTLAATKLEDYAVVFLVDIAPVPERVGSKLLTYVENGGNVVIFVGENTKPTSYPKALVPVQVSAPVGDADDRSQFRSVAWADFEHPLFQPFKEIPFTNFTNIHVQRFVTFTVGRAARAAVLAKLEGEKPFMVESRIGHGGVIAFSTTADVSWTNFPARNLFLPMMHQIVYYLTEQEAGRIQYVAGDQVAIIPPDSKQAVEVTDPLGRTKRLARAPDSKKIGVTYDDTMVMGTYTWRTVTPPVRNGIFVVNPPAQESNLAPLAEDELRKELAGCRLYFAHNANEVKKVLTEVREGVQLWNIMLIVVLGIAVVECFLANRKKPAAAKKEMRLAA